MIESGFKSDRGMFVRVSRVLVFLVAVFVCTSIVICPAHAEDSSTPSRFNEADESSGQDLGTQGAQPTNGQPGRELAGERSSSRDVTLSNAATPVGTDSSASKNESSAKPEADDSKADASAQQKPVKKPIKAGWMQDSDGTWYYFANPKAKPSTGWIASGGAWYWLQPDANGAMATSKWITDKDKEYYLTSSGVMATGWVKHDGKWYYANGSGAKVKNAWIAPGGRWYWLEADGSMAEAKWVSVKGADYYLAGSGVMATGWVKYDGKWYYTNGSGAKVKGGWIAPGGAWYWLQPDANGAMAEAKWVTDKGKKYYLTSSGAMATGWYTASAKDAAGKDAINWYYADGSGAQVKNGWVCPHGTWYWLQGDLEGDLLGSMATDRWISPDGKRYYLTESGAMALGWFKVKGDKSTWYYAQGSGAQVQSGWQYVNGRWYWFDKDKKGAMTNESLKTIDGKQYSFTQNGDMRSHCQVTLETKEDGTKIAGYAADSGAISRIGKFDKDGKLILTDDGGKIISGWHKTAGLWFYGASKTGIAYTGWLELGGVWYYLDSSGAMVASNRNIDGKYEQFDGSGRWLGTNTLASRAQGYSSGTNRLILVDRGAHQVGVFTGSQGNWSPTYLWSCVTGAPGTPTITGTFRTTGGKVGTLTTDSRAHYCTQIAGGYFFHTILASDSELGHSLSHGCIRLAYPNAQWIYNNITAGTTVAIFN